MSNQFVAAVALTARFVPAGTIAALATEFKVETSGWLRPVDRKVRWDSVPSGNTVTFKECAAAVAGMLQALWGTAKERAAFRVSATRHGVTGMNCNWRSRQLS
jgi:hypothetical protein